MNVIIDGNNLAHRVKHTFSLSNAGKDVSITYGFLKVLGSMLGRFDATSVIVCWDGGIPEFRRVAVPSYKANRHKDDDPYEYDNFLRQVRELGNYVLPMLGVINVRKVGAEADDLMYHVVKMLDYASVIVSTDKDMIQAIDNNVVVYNPTKKFTYDTGNIKEEFGVSLENYIDWRALQGDSSDNIPGIPGIGAKTATKLFDKFGELSSITNAAAGHSPIGEIKGKLGKNIVDFGFHKLARNIYTMALYADRVGARLAVFGACDDFQSFNKGKIKKYLMRNAFVSLMDHSFYERFKDLEEPIFKDEMFRTPVICGRRFPI